MAAITLDRLTKVYDDGTHAVTSLDLAIADGEFMVFVGPSGCGKTTALRMIAGLEAVTDGEIRIGDQLVNNLPAKNESGGDGRSRSCAVAARPSATWNGLWAIRFVFRPASRSASS